MTGHQTQYFIGTSGWNYRQWRGVFYPQDWPQRRWLEYYAHQFPVVELNATFYRRFPDKTYEKWRDQAPEGFRYALKAPRAVSHRKDLRDSVDSIQEFCRSANLLKERLGPILVQVGPNTRVDPEALDRALAAFDSEHHLAVEFRNDDWIAYAYSESELEEIAGFIRQTAEGRVSSVYVFVNCDIDGSGPLNADSLQRILSGQ